ncbi:MAG: DUF1385 domain-containing protein [Clostridia bacterium]|nr:DUF1385 domain-containing protein [Clostridia bacterium]
MKKTSIGGMALLEGIMMIGPNKKAVAIRKPDHEIEIQVEELKYNSKLRKVPFLRGVVALFSQMVHGVKALMKAADYFDVESDEPPTKFEKWLEKTFGDKLMNVVIYFSVIIALLFSVGLFILLPNLIISLIFKDQVIMNNLFEGILRIIIFVSYLALVSKMKDIRRVWMYHGAEHKTISTYEHDEELTVENTKKYTTFHKRCGTSFMFLVLIISIIVFSFTGWHSAIINVLIRLALIPVVAGISYEFIKLAGRTDGLFSKVVSAPGMWLQRLTTKEPDDDMVEVAIAAFKAVMPEVEGEDKW